VDPVMADRRAFGASPRTTAAGLAAAVVVLGAAAPRPASAADHLLITEVAPYPTAAEFVEIHNPTSAPVDLTDYYVTDFVLSTDPTMNYWRLPDAALVPDPSFPTDFLARFPAGAVIDPGETLVLCIQDDATFTATWQSLGHPGATADFELRADGDAVPDMVDPGPALVGAPLIQLEAGLSNSREVVVLFHWDGAGDLVEDVDLVQWSDAGPEIATVSPLKTGVSVDGPDADAVATSYAPDTPRAEQDLASPGPPVFGRTIRRVDLDEGTEPATGGNGLTGHDETGENLSVTWETDAMPTIGSIDDPLSSERKTWGELKARFR
jgi:Lamin Tail Domain